MPEVGLCRLYNVNSFSKFTLISASLTFGFASFTWSFVFGVWWLCGDWTLLTVDEHSNFQFYGSLILGFDKLASEAQPILKFSIIWVVEMWEIEMDMLSNKSWFFQQAKRIKSTKSELKLSTSQTFWMYSTWHPSRGHLCVVCSIPSSSS